MATGVAFFGGTLTTNAYQSPSVDYFSWYGDGITGGYVKCDNTILSQSDLTICNEILFNFINKPYLFATSTTGDNDTATGPTAPYPITGSTESPLGTQINLGNVNGYPITQGAYTAFYVLGDGQAQMQPTPTTTSTTTQFDYTDFFNVFLLFGLFLYFLLIVYIVKKQLIKFL